MKKILLIDGNHFIHRAFWGLPPLKTKNGKPTGAVYGFFSMIFYIIDSIEPDYISIAFDSREKTFRHEKDTAYKATREESPDDLKVQFPVIHELVKNINIRMFMIPGFEADDILSSISKKVIDTHKDIEVYIASGDMDIFQLISERVKIILPRKGVSDIQILNKDKFLDKYEIYPNQIKDYKGLCGDSSDNLKGVKGIGKKTATKLLKEYNNLENIYDSIFSIKSKKLQEKLLNDKDSAFHSKEMATLFSDIDIDFDLENSLISGIDYNRAMIEFQRLEFYVLIKRLQKYLKNGDEIPETKEDPPKKEYKQLSIF